jgi:hypothetical protein
MARVGGLLPTELEFALANWDGGSQHGEGDDSTAYCESTSAQDAELLRRLGMDSMVNTPRKRRLCTYYALGMLVHLQVTSGGNAWQIRGSCLGASAVVNADEAGFFSVALTEHGQSNVVREAIEAVVELSERLTSSSRYRIVPIVGRNVPVNQWLRAALLVLLADPTAVPSWAAAGEPPCCVDPDAGLLTGELEALDELGVSADAMQKGAWASPFSSLESPAVEPQMLPSDVGKTYD